ncbi:hypothetical protein D1AOALGA4SA_10774 [Olavius algarvensis Delta 1 endosymbiont]|nr:hypothetical protein D1AOALGA4SA_10774 [Olavius algarvensis Delta 1 endosymbiont]
MRIFTFMRPLYRVRLLTADSGDLIDIESGNPDGSYEITGIYPGQYIVRASSSGYINEYYNESDIQDDAIQLSINPNSEFENIDFSLEQGFTVVASVKNKHLPDGSFRTGLEVLIDGNFYGALPDDIDSITVTGPSGPLPITKDDFDYLEQWLDFNLNYSGSPEIGVYTFEVSSGGYTATATDTQDVLRTLPLIDENALSPIDGAVISTSTPNFSWEPIEFADDPNLPIYYRFEIYDDDPEQSGWRIFATRYDQNLHSITISPNLLEPGKTYYWRVRAADADDWIEVHNRTATNWFTFTTADPLGHSATPGLELFNNGIGAASWTQNAADPSTVMEHWVRVVDYDGISDDGSSHSVTVTYPNGGPTYDLYFIEWTHKRKNSHYISMIR